MKQWARQIKRDVVALWFAARDRRTPFSAKFVAGTVAAYLGTIAIPTLALVVAVINIVAIRERASRWLVTYAGLVAFAMAGLRA